MFLQPDNTFRGVLQFLGVDTAPAVLERCIDEASFQKMSGGRPPGTEDRASFMRQGKPANWRQHFSSESNRKFLSVAGDLMERLGYRT